MKFITIILIFIFFSCATTTKKGENMTPREEYYLGRSVAANIVSNSKLVTGEFNYYLNTLGTHLSFFSKRPETYKGYHFGLIKDNRSIAISAPGGIILISTGLLKTLETEDQLAAVLAHEISHIALYHAQEAIDQSSVSEIGVKAGIAVIGFFTGDDTLNRAIEHYDELISDYSEKMINGIYNKDQELAADKEAFKMLAISGYNSNALIDVLYKQKNEAGGVLSNHPSDKDRRSALQQRKPTNSNQGETERSSRFKKMKQNVSKWI